MVARLGFGLLSDADADSAVVAARCGGVAPLRSILSADVQRKVISSRCGSVVQGQGFSSVLQTARSEFLTNRLSREHPSHNTHHSLTRQTKDRLLQTKLLGRRRVARSGGHRGATEKTHLSGGAARPACARPPCARRRPSCARPTPRQHYASSSRSEPSSSRRARPRLSGAPAFWRLH